MKISYPLNKQLRLLCTLLLCTFAVEASAEIELVGFSAKMESNQVVLNWSAKNEKAFSHFTIERSVNGKEFRDVTLYFTEGEFGPRSIYSYKDKTLPTNQTTLFYRLRLNNIDGSFQYSETKIVKADDNMEKLVLAVYPNPVQNRVFVGLPVDWNLTDVVLDLYNGHGQLIRTTNEKRASVSLSLELDELPIGWYLLKASSGTKSISARIVKMK